MSRISDAVRVVDDIPSEIVPIALWNIEVEIRGMDLTTRTDYIAHLVEAREDDDQEALAKLDAEIIIACTYDPEDGSKAFLDGDADMLMTKAAAVIAPLSFKIQKLSGLDAGAEERLGKGFSTLALTTAPVVATTPSAVSSSPSPENSVSPPESLNAVAAPPSAVTS